MLESSGVQSLLRQAIDVVAPLGICTIVGAPAPDAEMSFNILTAVIKGSKVVGITQGNAIPRGSIPALAEPYRHGWGPFNELVSVYEFENIEQAAGDAVAGFVIKPVLRMPQSA